jgi:hypothetical protein
MMLEWSDKRFITFMCVMGAAFWLIGFSIGLMLQRDIVIAITCGFLGGTFSNILVMIIAILGK